MKKLYQELDQVKIKQTITPIRFKDEAINKIKKDQFNFGKSSYIFIPFIVSKDSHQKGLKLRIYKGSVKEKTTKKYFYIQYWFNSRSKMYKVGRYSQSFGVQECDQELIKLHKTHIDKKSGFWIKDPNETAKNDKRIVPKPDTTQAKGYTINETIEAYCGAEIPGEEIESGLSQ